MVTGAVAKTGGGADGAGWTGTDCGGDGGGIDGGMYGAGVGVESGVGAGGVTVQLTGAAGALPASPLGAARKTAQLSSPPGHVIGSARTTLPMTPHTNTPRASGLKADIANLLFEPIEIAVVTIPSATHHSSIRP
jgi:hypothetical protein